MTLLDCARTPLYILSDILLNIRYLGHPKKKFVSCVAAGFQLFSYQQQKKKKKKKEKEEKERILRLPEWPEFRPPAGQETHIFVKGGLISIPHMMSDVLGKHCGHGVQNTDVRRLVILTGLCELTILIAFNQMVI